MPVSKQIPNENFDYLSRPDSQLGKDIPKWDGKDPIEAPRQEKEMTETFTLFYNGPFSQWDDSEFEFHGMVFNRAEQFMMFGKAMLFKDFHMAKAIMATNDPRTQKKMGRQVENFDVDDWAKVAKQVVYVGSYCKFTQSKSHAKALENTGDTTLVEASPYDKIWGIGLSEYHLMAGIRHAWQGKNWLGEVLTQVREDIRNDTKDEVAIWFMVELVERYQRWLGGDQND